MVDQDDENIHHSNCDDADRRKCTQSHLDAAFQRSLSIMSNSLKNKYFVGRYTERRLVEYGAVATETYKDAIEIDNGETDVIRDLKNTHRSLNRLNTCILECDTGITLLANLNGVNFGKHLFMLEGFDLHQNVINFHVKWVRRQKDEEQSPSDTNEHDIFELNIQSIRTALSDLSECINTENTIFVLRMLVLAIIALIEILCKLIPISVNLVKELNVLMKTLVPVTVAIIKAMKEIVIALINSLTKMFGGLLIIFSMMWTGNYNLRRNNVNVYTESERRRMYEIRGLGAPTTRYPQEQSTNANQYNRNFTYDTNTYRYTQYDH